VDLIVLFGIALGLAMDASAVSIAISVALGAWIACQHAFVI